MSAVRPLDDETQRLIAQAQRLGIEPVLAMSDVNHMTPHIDAALPYCLPQDQHQTLLLGDGTLLMAGESHEPTIASVINVLRARQITYQLRPARQRIIDQLRHGGATQTPVSGPASFTRSDIQQLLDGFLSAAVRLGATDIHIETRENTPCRVRFRINGMLEDHDEIAAGAALALANVVFNAEARRGAEQFQPSRHQDAAFDSHVGNVPVRVATIAEVRGWDLILRLRASQETLALDDLGLSVLERALLRDAMRQPHGMIVVTGPTGSGKSSLLFALLVQIDARYKVISLEDPVEALADNITHVTVSRHQTGADYAAALTAVNRWDSNINVLGEIRDAVTAQACKALSTVGKLVLTTLHTNRALLIPSRLEDLGLSAATLAEPELLRLLVNQRLLPTLCADCAVTLDQVTSLDSVQRARFTTLFGADLAALRFTHPPGCTTCGYSGRQGVQLVLEMIAVDEPGRACIRRRDYDGWRRHLIEQGWQDILMPTIALVRSGRVDPAVAEMRVGNLDGSSAGVHYGALATALMEAADA